MVRLILKSVFSSLFVLCSLTSVGEEETAATLSALYPGVSIGALSLSTLGTLPEAVLLKSGSVEVTVAELDAELAEAAADKRGQYERNKLFALENIATPKLLLQAAPPAQAAGQESGVATEAALAKYKESITADVAVTEEEVAAFYEANKDMCGGATLVQIKDQLKNYVLEQKKQDVINEHIRTIGQRTPIVLAADWTQKQAKLALDNPVDKARASGKPSIVDFGSTGCRSCAMMAPILKALEAKYAGKANVLFVHVKEEEVLTARYGIRTIPVQVFFDKDGKEVYRHSGTMTQDEIEKRLVEMGAIL